MLWLKTHCSCCWVTPRLFLSHPWKLKYLLSPNTFHFIIRYDEIKAAVLAGVISLPDFHNAAYFSSQLYVPWGNSGSFIKQVTWAAVTYGSFTVQVCMWQPGQLVMKQDYPLLERHAREMGWRALNAVAAAVASFLPFAESSHWPGKTLSRNKAKEYLTSLAWTIFQGPLKRSGPLTPPGGYFKTPHSALIQDQDSLRGRYIIILLSTTYINAQVLHDFHCVEQAYLHHYVFWKKLYLMTVSNPVKYNLLLNFLEKRKLWQM